MTTITGSPQARSPMRGVPTRFVRHDHFPPGWEVCAEQFLALFHRYGYIYKAIHIDGGSWYSANEKWKLTDSEILKAIAGKHSQFVGTRAGKSTRFAVLDIDQSSRYHNEKALKKLLQTLSDGGIQKSCLYRSSYSGGWHLYLFFEEQLNSADLRRQLVRLLTLNDFQIAKGQLELFPCPGSGASLGMGLRLPLQPGWAWLNKQTLEVDYERLELSATKALELFVDDLEADANPSNCLRRLKNHNDELQERREKVAALGHGTSGSNVVPIRRSERSIESGEFVDFVRAVFYKLPPGILVDNWYKGRIYHLNGLTGPSQRAESIECLSHYFFYGDPSRDLPALGYGYEKEREWAIREFLATRNNGCSKDIDRRRPDAIDQAERASNWKPARKRTEESRKYSPEKPIAWVRGNTKRKTEARKRIQEAFDGIRKLGRSFTTVELQEAAKCSRETLYRHADIWRKDYEDLAEGFFAICTGEYNVMVGAACPKSEPPSTLSQKNMPPGRLAARRIAYEISMRAQRDMRCRRKTEETSKDLSEKHWRDSVERLTTEHPSELPIVRLKTLLHVLSNYLSMAPYEEDATVLQRFIAHIKVEIQLRLSGPDPPA